MKELLLIIITILLASSCGQDYNSNSFDDLLYAGSSCSGDAAEVRFCEAFTIIKDKCVSCHSGWHDSYATFDTSQKWIDAGLIVSNDATNSQLMTRIKGYGTGASATMPLNSSELTQSEKDTLEAWIDGL